MLGMGGPRPLHRRSQRLGVLAVFLAGLFGDRAARAEPPAALAEPFRMVWSAPPGCGDAAGFLAELRSRTAHLRPAKDGEFATTLIAELLGEAAGVRGRLTVRKLNGELLTREVPGRTCQEVVSAMALIAALMVDPLALTSDGPSAAPEAPPPSAPSASPSPAPSTAPPPPVASNRAPERRWAFGVEQRLTARTAVAPELAWGEAVSLMLLWQGSSFRPSLELSAHRARATASRSFGSAELNWTAAQLTLCPWGTQPGPRWDVRACAQLQVGRLLGTGYATRNPAEGTIFWSSAGLQLEARTRLLGPLWLGLDAGALRPFSRESFYLAPTQTLHRIPSWGFNFGGGVGLLFL